jgi:hypothetical protein
MNNIYDIARESKRENTPERTQKSKAAIVVAEIWQAGENPSWDRVEGIFLARLALSKISRETVST